MPSAESRPLAVITGAAGHVGLACARRFRDFRLLISDVGEEAIHDSAAKLTGEGLQATAFVADITKEPDVLELARAAAREGGFQVLIHAAGVAPPTPPEVIYAVNLWGTIHVLDAFEPLLEPGVVGVCIASMAGYRTLGHRFDALLLEPAGPPTELAQRIESESPGTPRHRLAYAVSKRGTILQVQRRAREWGRRGARVLSVSPGVLGDTTMGARRQSGLDHQGGDSPLGRLGTSAEVAEVVRFAASSAASLMTGTDLLVDAGYVASANHHFEAQRRDRWHALEF
jgi:NAD(P)-dependent dehydrogenase (short-subunit alcohol dehydrogenase family)